MRNLYLIATVPPEDISEEIDNIRKEFSRNYKCYAALKPPVHLTLREPFKLEIQEEAKLLRTLKGLSLRNQPFTQTLQNFDKFHKDVIYIKVEKVPLLNQLKIDIKNLIKTHFPLTEKEKHTFKPHITIAYKDIPKDSFDIAFGEYQKITYSKQFVCNHFVLFKHDGKQWNKFADYKLEGLPQQTLFDNLTSWNSEKLAQN